MDTFEFPSVEKTYSNPSTIMGKRSQYQHDTIDSFNPIDPYDQDLRRLINNAVPPEELVPVIEKIFSGRSIVTVDHFQRSDVQAFIDTIDQVRRRNFLPF